MKKRRERETTEEAGIKIRTKMTEALGIRLRIIPKEATLWKCPYCSLCIFFIPFLKETHKIERRERGSWGETINSTTAAD
jgi:hypothetical protein